MAQRYNNDVITTEVNYDEKKLPVHSSTKVSKRYKRNAIISDLKRATRIASFLADKIPKIKKSVLMLTIHINLSMVSLITFKINQWKLTTGPFPLASVMLLKVVLVDANNEEFSKNFMKKFDVFSDNKHGIRIKWIPKKVKQLFKQKSKKVLVLAKTHTLVRL